MPLELPPEDILIDHQRKLLYVVPSRQEALLVRLDQTLPRQAKEFDQKYKDDVRKIGQELFRLTSIMKLFHAESVEIQRSFPDPELMSAAGSLTSHMLMSIEAAIDMMRRGYRFQVPVLLRHAVEVAATLICITVREGALAELVGGKFKSTNTIAEAKKVFPTFGHLYGYLSNAFMHVGESFATWEPLKSTRDPVAAEGCIVLIRSCLLVARFCIELAFYDYIKETRLLVMVEPGKYRFRDEASLRDWFLRELGVDITGSEPAGN